MERKHGVARRTRTMIMKNGIEDEIYIFNCDPSTQSRRFEFGVAKRKRECLKVSMGQRSLLKGAS